MQTLSQNLHPTHLDSLTSAILKNPPISSAGFIVIASTGQTDSHSLQLVPEQLIGSTKAAFLPAACIPFSDVYQYTALPLSDGANLIDPIGQIPLHALQSAQGSEGRPKGVDTFLFGALPVNPITAGPIFSRHKFTQRPH